LSFKERDDLPKYHPDVRTFEVRDEAGKVVGIYFLDPFARPSKRGGAWMNSYRKQSKVNGENIIPIIVNVTNFPKSNTDVPTLLTFDQASTTFHEFGHALHGLLSDGVYNSQTGTAVPRDYVEFPSQVMEYWFGEEEVLKNFAKHYQTGEVIPSALLAKIQNAATFNQGFFTSEYMAAAYLDLAWYTLEDTAIQDAHALEAKTMNGIGLIDQIAPRYRTTYFAHIFSGGYSAGYYSYLWTDVLAADAFQAFKEKGIFDKATAAAFKKYIFAAGGTDDSMTLYRRFRGKDPEIEPLLRSKGLIESK
jgi:peptidyl-dipeptidase Dcp